MWIIKGNKILIKSYMRYIFIDFLHEVGDIVTFNTLVPQVLSFICIKHLGTLMKSWLIRFN